NFCCFSNARQQKARGFWIGLLLIFVENVLRSHGLYFDISHTAVGAPVMLWRFRSIFVVFQMPDSKKPDSFESGFS
ncbi:hypothetical protein, partial [Colwellia sp. MB02u-7]|uniref:hypothetical protein n=1 Tax=Colwellia sp. MB02u-7 TaxID=2759814 RepID=UPI001C70C850